jgi:hypothetical protein
MKKPLIVQYFDLKLLNILMFLATVSLNASAQDTLSGRNGKALNIPFRKYGLSIGNSKNFNGIRINIVDNAVQHVNGVNLTGWTNDYGKNEVVNGLHLGIIPTARLSHAVTIGLFGTGVEHINGLVYGTVAIGSKTINGISLAGFVNSSAGNISGISMAGIGIFTHKSVNGIAVSVPIISAEGNINGLAIDVGYIQSKKTVRGMTVTAGYLNAAEYKGVAISGFSRTERMFGLSFALFNRTSELHGLQIGLLNYAGNNPKGLRMLPVLNLHMGKTKVDRL